MSKPANEEKFTIEEAFDWCFKSDKSSAQEDFDNERGLRSIAFLLQDLSQGGNADVERYVAYGLGDALKVYADRWSQDSALSGKQTSDLEDATETLLEHGIKVITRAEREARKSALRASGDAIRAGIESRAKAEKAAGKKVAEIGRRR